MTPGSILASGSRSRPRIVAGGDGEVIRDLVGEPATSRGALAGPPSVAEPGLRVPEQGARRGSHQHDPGNPAGGDGGAAGGLAVRFRRQSRQPAHGREASAHQARRLAEINPRDRYQARARSCTRLDRAERALSASCAPHRWAIRPRGRPTTPPAFRTTEGLRNDGSSIRRSATNAGAGGDPASRLHSPPPTLLGSQPRISRGPASDGIPAPLTSAGTRGGTRETSPGTPYEAPPGAREGVAARAAVAASTAHLPAS